ncbi:MAG: thiol-disulfide oxidoreductase DCC family protein [Bdellovibrionales bacterium]
MSSPRLFFDGHCNLCNGFVDFLIRHDRSKKILFGSLQGKAAAASLPPHFRELLPSVVLVENGEIYSRSSAALKALALLGGIYKLGLIFFLVPRPIRDWVYDLIAKNRYAWFGRRDTCRLPSPEERERFLD